MSGRLFSRQRIRGVTFRHVRSAAGAGRSKDAGTSGPQAIRSLLGKKDSSTSAENIRNSAPPPLLERDLHRLLGDYGRNELHTLVSEAVDQLVQLKQLNQSFQRLMPDSAPDRKFLNTDESEELLADPLLETGVELVRVQRLWKHRLDMLEMIATAQDSLRNFSAKSAKTRPPPEAGSARRQK